MRIDDRENLPPFATGKCTLCSGDSKATWTNLIDLTTIEFCERCAVERLPTLIADAMPSTDPDDIKSTLKRVGRAFRDAVSKRSEREFWKAVREEESWDERMDREFAEAIGEEDDDRE